VPALADLGCGADDGVAFEESPYLASFQSLSAISVSFEQASFPSDSRLFTNGLEATNGVQMTVGAARLVDDGPDDPTKTNQRHVLAQIERDARARGDLGRANDAQYRQRQLTSSGYGRFTRALDFVFYRTLAGYFVRPWNPLCALLLLAAVAAVLHLLGFARVDGFRKEATRALLPNPVVALRLTLGSVARFLHAVARHPLASLRRALSAVPPFAREVLETLGSGFWRREELKPLGVLRRVEIVGYRLLLACLVIALANSNPTLRQLVDAIS